MGMCGGRATKKSKGALPGIDPRKRGDYARKAFVETSTDGVTWREPDMHEVDEAFGSIQRGRRQVFEVLVWFPGIRFFRYGTCGESKPGDIASASRMLDMKSVFADGTDREVADKMWKVDMLNIFSITVRDFYGKS